MNIEALILSAARWIHKAAATGNAHRAIEGFLKDVEAQDALEHRAAVADRIRAALAAARRKRALT